MLMEVTASAIISLGGVPTSGASDTARFVAFESNRGMAICKIPMPLD